MATQNWDTPPVLWMNGKLDRWGECKVHVTSGYAQRGASIFEGIRIYKSPRSGIYVALGLEDHLKRLDNTWRMLSLPVSYPRALLRKAVAELLSSREFSDGYCRVTRYLDVRGQDGVAEADGAIVALYKQASRLGQPLTCAISRWRRNELAVPAQMKIGGHYFMLTIAKRQAQQAGADEAILLNENNCITETTGAAIFVFASGELVTPPLSDGILPSITARIVIKLAADLGITTVIRSIHWAELMQAQGAFIAGSLDELRPIVSVDGVSISNVLTSNLIADLFQSYSSLCRADSERKWADLIAI